ncbi:MAG: hypothetical protein ABIL09_10995 [Gemmatimonadota bacterium]
MGSTWVAERTCLEVEHVRYAVGAGVELADLEGLAEEVRALYAAAAEPVPYRVIAEAAR